MWVPGLSKGGELLRLATQVSTYAPLVEGHEYEVEKSDKWGSSQIPDGNTKLKIRKEETREDFSVKAHDGGERPGILMRSLLLYTIQKFPTLANATNCNIQLGRQSIA